MKSIFRRLNNTNGSSLSSRQRNASGAKENVASNGASSSYTSLPTTKTTKRKPVRKIHTIRYLLLVTVPICLLFAWNQSYVLEESEAPLDHLFPTLLWPFLKWQGCPASDPKAQQQPLEDVIPMVMISARPKEQVDPILLTWTKAGFPVQLFNTSDFSRTYENTRCLQLTFKSRLFAVYQHVLETILQRSKNDSSTHQSEFLVTIEDDVRLLDAARFRAELQHAYQQRYDYYSFTKNHDRGCIYEFGTPAQLWGPGVIQSVLNAPTGSFCRLPIDMYVATLGPWFVTRRRLVQHVGKRVWNP